jgi:RHS repeat-associated protein
VVQDAVGRVISTFLYGPYGEVVWAVGGGTHRRQFNGKEFDAWTGLTYYGARYYDKIALRWTGADPLNRFFPEAGQSWPQRQNLYAFSLNNPLRYYDPDGRNPFYQLSRMQAGANKVGEAYERVEEGVNTALDTLQTVSDVAGYIPGPIGCIADMVSACISLVKGDYETAALSVLFAVGLDFLKGGKHADEAMEFTSKNANEAPLVTRGGAPPGPGLGSADARRVEQQRTRRAERRERQSREGPEGALDQAGNPQKQSGEGFRDHENANRGPSGERPAGPDRRHNRERNVGIDEEHSRRPKGGFR